MPSLKLSNLFRRDQAAPTLRERASGLKSSLARIVQTRPTEVLKTADTASQPALSPVRAWAVEQAAAMDLSGLTILELHNLYCRFDAVAADWCATGALPWASEEPRGCFRKLNAGGQIVEREEERAGEIRSRLVEEIRAKTPANSLERNWRLEILIRFELLCEASLEYAPELRAEIDAAWGR